ncbi:MAG TPA: diguanylate cyclase [Albitalea sp.]
MRPAPMPVPSLVDRLLGAGVRQRMRLVHVGLAAALVAGAVAYALAGEARGAVLLVPVVLLALGMVAMQPAALRRFALFAAALFGAAMAGMAALEPAAYAPRVELVHFVVLAAALLAVALVAGELAGLRERLQAQERELDKAKGRLQDLATRDQLTGLVNRRYAQDVLALEHQRCMRSGHPFCVAMLDLDHFKSINDSHGQSAGDELLRRFAAEASEAIRISDVLARWGGEEFLLLMTDTRGSLGRLAVDRLRERIAQLPARADHGMFRLTFSAGVAEHRAGEPVSDTIARADQALIAAKAQGRNRVVLH